MIVINSETARALLCAMFMDDDDAKREADEAFEQFLDVAVIAMSEERLENITRLLRPRLAESHRRRIMADLEHISMSDLPSFLESAAHEHRAIMIEISRLESR